MVTVLTIIGTRPEAIKLASVIRRLQQYNSRVRSIVCVTGQHRELLDPMLSFFSIVPDYDLDLMRPRQSLAYLTSTVLQELEPILIKENPDWVLVQGDTTTALSGALAAFYQKIRVGHIEAGLRSGNRSQPFPEEINRRLIDQLATVRFAPTLLTQENLLREGFPAESIYVTGNTVIDALFTTLTHPYQWRDSPLRAIPDDRRLILVTSHRRENVGEPLRHICLAVRDLAHIYHNSSHFVMPVHPNPEVAGVLFQTLGHVPNISLIKPLDYVSLIHLMGRCYLILTDSGGIQEEAPSLGIPVLVLRHHTDRPETLAAGVAKMVGTGRETILREARLLLDNVTTYRQMAKVTHLYGDGRAARRIVDILLTVTDETVQRF